MSNFNKVTMLCWPGVPPSLAKSERLIFFQDLLLHLYDYRYNLVSCYKGEAHLKNKYLYLGKNQNKEVYHWVLWPDPPPSLSEPPVHKKVLFLYLSLKEIEIKNTNILIRLHSHTDTDTETYRHTCTHTYMAY